MTEIAPNSAEIELVLLARSVELPGGLPVHRALPQRQRRTVGPFVFVDQMGPAPLPAEREITVLPHPHIGLSTVTYLFEGEGLHRDSLGSVQRILPGEVNWMTAGSGIVHSERVRSAASGRIFGVQIWVALPRELEETAPRFEHYDAGAVPVLRERGATTRLIAGSLHGATSSVSTTSALFYADLALEPGAASTLPAEYDERAAFVLEGSVSVAGTTLGPGELAFFRRGTELALRSEPGARLLLLGGAPLDEPRYLFWNFVSSSKDRLRQAADDWRHQRFEPVPGETAFIPLPEDASTPVNYP